jgi:hypothetical protein
MAVPHYGILCASNGFVNLLSLSILCKIITRGTICSGESSRRSWREESWHRVLWRENSAIWRDSINLH